VKPICDIDNIVKSSCKQQDKSSAVSEMDDRAHNRHGPKSTLRWCAVSSKKSTNCL